MSDDTTSDYQRMAEAIRFLDDAGEAPVTLDALASHLGLSASHFQRVFSRWVGVSPKKYQQYLTLNHAKSLLEDRFTVLDTALESGLSGPGRLHDLFISWEAMTPGDYAKGGSNLLISYGFSETPFGDGLIMWTERGICGLAFTAETGRETALSDMQSRWPLATYQAADATPMMAGVFAANPRKLRLSLIGAPFQVKVWEALLAIPSGHVTTYSEIAGRIGNPKAVRAVGTAVGRNPVSWLIPCHRALRKSGGLGGYHWGLPVKRAMIAFESARLEAGN